MSHIGNLARRVGRRLFPRPERPAVDFGPVQLLSVDPPVFLTGIPFSEYLGMAGAWAAAYGNSPAGFIVFPTWTIERPGFPEAMRDRFVQHTRRYPNHRFRFICNTEEERRLLSALGLPALFLNKNFTVSERLFTPLPPTGEFDAVYNARFVPSKRHHLAALIPRVGYVTYVDNSPGSYDQFRALSAETLARAPDHVILNEIVDGLPRGMPYAEINTALARGSVGLLLSEAEGSSYASMEYLLAGLPVVSTPSKGGREAYFDPDFCITCDPDPALIRDAVAALKARNIPREQIRERTLEKILPARERLMDLVDELRVELGGSSRSGKVWIPGERSGVWWRPFRLHLAAYEAEKDRSALAVRLGLPSDALFNVQLTAGEIAPIAEAIRSKPGCSLLVFGAGNDSAFWESVNRGGTTAFLEDVSEWAEAARKTLTTAAVYDVAYDTLLKDWERLLDAPKRLSMKLPPEIADQRWDVIIVDGPAGHADETPGRMQSIYAASKLVAPGGRVFVHDCERPAEAALASRYLGDERVFVEIDGRAKLRGYAF